MYIKQKYHDTPQRSKFVSPVFCITIFKMIKFYRLLWHEDIYSSCYRELELVGSSVFYVLILFLIALWGWLLVINVINMRCYMYLVLFLGIVPYKEAQHHRQESQSGYLGKSPFKQCLSRTRELNTFKFLSFYRFCVNRVSFWNVFSVLSVAYVSQSRSDFILNKVSIFFPL